MPQDWVAPEVFMKHNGHRVFHTYRNDVFQDGRRDFIFSLLEGCNEIEERRGAFDVRELPNNAAHNVQSEDGQKAVIRDAFDSGFFDDCEQDDPEPRLTGMGLPLHTIVFQLIHTRSGEVQVEAATPEEAVKLVEEFDENLLLEQASQTDSAIEAWVREAGT